jgi:Flp pilus assembly protein TadD
LIQSDAHLTTELSLTHQAARPKAGRKERYMVHLVNFSPVRRTPKHTDFHDDPIPLINVTVRVNLPLAASTAKALYAGKDLPVRRVASGGVEFLVPRVDIHDSAIEILRLAGRADTSAAMNRLASCDADDELLSLARDRLAAKPPARPADAGVVASRLNDYLAGVQERLRKADDPDGLTPEQVSDLIKPRPPEMANAIAMALDDWAAVRRDLRNDPAGAKRLAATARSADSDPWRNNLRDALQVVDRPARRARLVALAASVKDQEMPVVSMDLLGKALGDAGAKAEAESVLRRGCRAHPGDVWLNYDLARSLETLARREEAIRYYTAARMLRPETAHELAHALRMKGESEEAIGVFRDLARIRPGNGRHLSCLGHALLSRGLRDEARQTLTEAVTVLHKTIAARPDDLYAHLQLGNALRYQNRLDAALVMYRKAARIKPTNPDPLDMIGSDLVAMERYDEAVTIFRDSLRLAADNTVALEGLGSALQPTESSGPSSPAATLPSAPR